MATDVTAEDLSEMAQLSQERAGAPVAAPSPEPAPKRSHGAARGQGGAAKAKAAAAAPRPALTKLPEDDPRVELRLDLWQQRITEVAMGLLPPPLSVDMINEATAAQLTGWIAEAGVRIEAELSRRAKATKGA